MGDSSRQCILSTKLAFHRDLLELVSAVLNGAILAYPL
jgi:hypothetical protein